MPTIYLAYRRGHHDSDEDTYYFVEPRLYTSETSFDYVQWKKEGGSPRKNTVTFPYEYPDLEAGSVLYVAADPIVIQCDANFEWSYEPTFTITHELKITNELPLTETLSKVYKKYVVRPTSDFVFRHELCLEATFTFTTINFPRTKKSARVIMRDDIMYMCLDPVDFKQLEADEAAGKADPMEELKVYLEVEKKRKQERETKITRIKNLIGEVDTLHNNELDKLFRVLNEALPVYRKVPCLPQDVTYQRLGDMLVAGIPGNCMDGEMPVIDETVPHQNYEGIEYVRTTNGLFLPIMEKQ